MKYFAGITRQAIALCSKSRAPTPFHIWALGMAIAIGGNVAPWNKGISCGFGNLALASFLIGTAYICLILCTSEMISALPFAGGTYGLARCTLGFFPGFLVGCSEVVEYITYVSLSSANFVEMLRDTLGVERKYEPLICLCFYVLSCSIHIRGKLLFWGYNCFFGILSFSITLLYCIGLLNQMDFKKYALNNNSLFYGCGGVPGFLVNFNYPVWLFVGVESLVFACNNLGAQNPRKIIPKGSIACVLTLFSINTFVIFVCSSIPPGVQVLSGLSFPLQIGFSLGLGCTKRTAMFLSLPASFATAYGFIFSYSNLIRALAASKLFPDFLSWTGNSTKTPYNATLVGSLLSYLIYLLIFSFPGLTEALFGMCCFSAFVAYCAQCIGYYALQTKFKSIKRTFRSPLGNYGAVYAFLVFCFGIISSVGFQTGQKWCLVMIITSWIVFTTYYYFVSKAQQTFSAEENRVLLVAHTINHNRRIAFQNKHGVKRKNVVLIYRELKINPVLPAKESKH